MPDQKSPADHSRRRFLRDSAATAVGSAVVINTRSPWRPRPS
jgi:alkaline phosphatase D